MSALDNDGGVEGDSGDFQDIQGRLNSCGGSSFGIGYCSGSSIDSIVVVLVVVLVLVL